MGKNNSPFDSFLSSTLWCLKEPKKGLCFKNVSVEIYESFVLPLQCWKKLNFRVELLSYKATP